MIRPLTNEKKINTLVFSFKYLLMPTYLTIQAIQIS